MAPYRWIVVLTLTATLALAGPAAAEPESGTLRAKLPDGSTLEIARRNDVLTWSLLIVVASPMMWLTEPAITWELLTGFPQAVAKQVKPVDNTAAQARLKRLIAERQAPAGGSGRPD